MANPVPVSYINQETPIAGGKISARQPRIVVGSYVGNNASNRDIPLGFAPDLVIVKGGPRRAMYIARFGWHGRANGLNASDSELWMWLRPDGFRVGWQQDVNYPATTYHYIAIQDNGSGLLQQTAWIGNITDNRVIDWTTRDIELVFVKRDSPRAAAIKHRGLADNVSLLTTGATGTHVRALRSRGITVDASNNTNENNGGATIGEGLEGIAFCAHDCIDVVHWTGDGTTSRQIATKFAPAWALLMRNDGGAPLPEIVSTTMAAGESGPVGAVAMASGAVSGLTASGITLGDSSWNANGVSYTALCVKASSTTLDRQAPKVSGKYVELSGTASAISFGKNASLNVGGGAFTLEWYGKRLVSGVMVPLWMRGNGARDGTKAANAGEYSWGLFSYPPVDPISHGWVGDVLRVVHSNYLAAEMSESNTNWYSWCTGILTPDDDMHLMLTHNGTGTWRLYLNGEICKQREMNMTLSTWGSRGNAGTGNHDAVIGARMTAADELVDSAAMRLYLARIYNAELTDAQCRARYQRAVLGMQTQETTPLEEWACTDGSGTTLSATYSAANNATISGGTWGNR